MDDHLGTLTQARDALIRGQLADATGALTWLAMHREPNALAAARPLLGQMQAHAQRAIDTSDLKVAAQELGGVAASCGQCHAAMGKGPKPEPSGFEQLDDELTVATHMHGYLWATETLWNALVADAGLWDPGVAALATLEPPTEPSKLAPGFSAIRAWASAAKTLTTPKDRAQAYGELLASCGGCHVREGIDPGRSR